MVHLRSVVRRVVENSEKGSLMMHFRAKLRWEKGVKIEGKIVHIRGLWTFF